MKYMYPAGCAFNGGTPFASPIVRGPVAFTDQDGVQRPKSIFKRPDILAEIGVKPWREERPAAGYQIVEGSTPTDTEVNGEIIRTWEVEPIEGYAEHQLNAAKDAKLAEIIKASGEAVAPFIADYSMIPEIISWKEQEMEAAKFSVSGLESDAPFLSAIAQERGITLSDLVEKVNNNVAVYKAFSARVLGRQQRYEDELKAAVATGDIEAVKAITPDFSDITGE